MMAAAFTTHIPLLTLCYGVPSGTAKGMTAQQTPNCQRTATNDAVALDRLFSIFGTRGHITAGDREHRRDPSLVATERELDEAAHNYLVSLPSGRDRLRFAARASRAFC